MKFANYEKLAEINQMIRDLKSAGMYGRQLDVLCAIAADLHARITHSRTKVLETLEKKIAYCDERKTSAGHDQTALAYLGGYVIGFWPTIRAALIDQAKAEKESA